MSLRLLLPRQLPSTLRTSTRSFSLATRLMAEGDAGATRPGGVAQGDAFTKREKANEDYYVQKRQQERLEALRKKISESESQLSKDKKELEDIQKKQ